MHRVESGRIIQNPLKLVTSAVRCNICLQDISEHYVAHAFNCRADEFGNAETQLVRFVYCASCVEATRDLQDGETGISTAMLHRLYVRMIDEGLERRSNAEQEQLKAGDPDNESP